MPDHILARSRPVAACVWLWLLLTQAFFYFIVVTVPVFVGDVAAFDGGLLLLKLQVLQCIPSCCSELRLAA